MPDRRRPVPMLAAHMADRAAAGGPGRHDLTLDAGLQARIEALAARWRAGRDARLGLAVVVADHRSGEILASVGAADYGDAAAQGWVDMTRAPRSPGSTLKPLVYGLAFDRGLAHPETLIRDTPVSFDGYAPQNFDGLFRGDVSVRDALQHSLNIPVVRLTEALGPAHVTDAMARAGADPVLPGGAAGLAVSLGGVGVTLEGLVQLYAALAEGGTARPLRWRREGRDDDGGRAERILSPRAAWQVGDILAGRPPPGGGAPGRVAWKTGTSYGHRDALALGWDGRLVAGVWIGRPDGTPVPGAFGGDLAAPLLFEVLGLAAPRATPLPPPPSDTLIVPNARLPQALRRFGGAAAEGPAFEIVFPPDGARLGALGRAAVPLKLRGGTPPFAVLVDGAPVLTGERRADLAVPVARSGPATLSVIDAAGRSERVRVRLD
ncbi:penicillin-binding protein 1C [Roseivivax isoporae LMG 25204]|uniref:Penicillin-binding protein 1C n=1 Tax=Roseivivax isoporae LMG 25204 TaxID=1449351 RepID=X7F273_9RHOB|nr:penicillin-binding protein 1C [Roseivivax isoporae LMG 25204]